MKYLEIPLLSYVIIYTIMTFVCANSQCIRVNTLCYCTNCPCTACLIRLGHITKEKVVETPRNDNKYTRPSPIFINSEPREYPNIYHCVVYPITSSVVYSGEIVYPCYRIFRF